MPIKIHLIVENGSKHSIQQQAKHLMVILWIFTQFVLLEEIL